MPAPRMPGSHVGCQPDGDQLVMATMVIAAAAASVRSRIARYPTRLRRAAAPYQRIWGSSRSVSQSYELFLAKSVDLPVGSTSSPEMTDSNRPVRLTPRVRAPSIPADEHPAPPSRNKHPFTQSQSQPKGYRQRFIERAALGHGSLATWAPSPQSTRSPASRDCRPMVRR